MSTWYKNLFSYIDLEYGTYSQEQSRKSLREDHWLHNKGDVIWDDTDVKRIKRQIKHHYHPGSKDWLEMVLYRSRQILRQATEALSAEQNGK